MRRVSRARESRGLFGEGVTSNTVLRGFRITGAGHFVTGKLTEQIEPNTTIPKNLFFYTEWRGHQSFRAFLSCDPER